MSFQQEILRTCEVPMKYEDSQLLDKVLEILPLEFIYTRAEEAEKQDSAWGLQDYVIRELLKWFKHSFFTWVNSPSCESCSGETQRQGIGQPTDQERIQGGAGHVEIYNCTQCGKIERFPRYGNAAILLQTRRGRCGEWANCFTLLCRALGSRVRYILNSEDHVWTEVFSEKQQRWIHVDSCEEAWDNPTLYERGWGKRMAYCIAFSVEGAMDVTKRYVRDNSKKLPRDKLSENDLKQLLDNITALRISDMLPEEQVRIMEERDNELTELSSYSVDDHPSAPVGPRQTGSGEWTEKRGENGSK